MNVAYVQAACFCTSLRKCDFCRKWTDPNYKPRPKLRPKPRRTKP